MQKENSRDYATEAFRYYASLGCPRFEEFREKIYLDAAKRAVGKDPEAAAMEADEAIKKSMPQLLDIFAVEKTIENLERSDKGYIIAAIEDVYFVQPNKPLKHGELTDRVRRSSFTSYTGERTVYGWLREARQMFAEIRGLRVN